MAPSFFYQISSKNEGEGESNLQASANSPVQELSKTRLRWLNGSIMQVIWSDFRRDLIFLTPKEDICAFSGNFENDLLAKADVKGCISDEQTRVEIMWPDQGVEPRNIVLLLLKNGTTLE